MPGNNGGANFSGAAIDPEHATMFIVSKDFPAMLKLTLSGPDTGDPATTRYKSGFGFMVTSSGLSAIKPPWTTFTAYDLNLGTIKWQIPLGQIPELAAKGFADTGAHFPKTGPVVTAGGLIFTGTRDRDIRALDVETGKELWKAEMDAALEGIPAVYEVNGKEYIVYCAAARATTHMHAAPGHPASSEPVAGAYVAFALPTAK
jgi:quinoprotein glucose dehydrogenase